MSIYHSSTNPFLDRRPYVYAIMWTRLNLAYVGVRHARGCDPSDLWRTYFTSSQYVADIRSRYGDPDHIEVIDVFLTARDAIAAEFDIITTFDLHRSPVFVNKACGSNFVQDAEVRRKISEGGKRRYEDPAERERSRLLSTGKKHRPESIEKMRVAKAGIAHTSETRSKISKAKNDIATRFDCEGELLTALEMAERTGITPRQIHSRLSAGLTPKEAMTQGRLPKGFLSAAKKRQAQSLDLSSTPEGF